MNAFNPIISMANDLVLDSPLGATDKDVLDQFDELAGQAIEEGDEPTLEALLDVKYLLCIRKETRNLIQAYLEKDIEDIELVEFDDADVAA